MFDTVGSEHSGRNTVRSDDDAFRAFPTARAAVSYVSTAPGGCPVELTDIAAAIRRLWWLVAVCLVVAICVAAVYVIRQPERSGVVRYTSVVTLDVPSRDAILQARRENPRDVPEFGDVPNELLVGLDRMALSESLRRAAVQDAGVTIEQALPLRFSAELTNDGYSFVMTVSALEREVARSVADAWVAAYLKARREVTVESAEDERRSVIRNLTSLRAQLAQLVTELNARGVAAPPPPTRRGDDAAPAVPAPETVDIQTLLDQFEISALRAEIAEQGQRYGDIVVAGTTANPYAEIIDSVDRVQRPPEPPSPVVPALLVVLGGLAVGLAAAVAISRFDRRIRDPKTAAAILGAPVLCEIPAARRREASFALLDDPRSDRSEAFRALAATSIATDRLPRAIMLSSPSGTAQDEVAANFAAALAGLGVRVALVATDARQRWFVKPFDAPELAPATLPDLLVEAHAGSLNGQLRRSLPRSEQLPNLVVVPPGTGDDDLGASLDGLPPLLEALAEDGNDVVVIAGPSVLDEADATIVAWATRSVLWVVEEGTVTRDDAATAASRLELAGVEPFGVALVSES